MAGWRERAAAAARETAPRTALPALCGTFVALQLPMWALPPFSDALGHVFPQATLLLASNWSFRAVAASDAAEHPPLLTALVAAGWSLFGVGPVWPHVLSTGIGVLALLGIYRLAAEVTSPGRAVAAAACVAMNPVFFSQCANPYIDIGVVAGLAWALYFFFTGNPLGVGVSLAVMTLSKETSIPLAIVIGALAVARGHSRGEMEWGLVAAIALAMLPCVGWLAYTAAVKGRFLAASVAAASTNGSVAVSAPAFLRKIALGPIQLLVMGLWVPMVMQLWSRARRRSQRSTERWTTIDRFRLVTLLVVALTSVVEHGVISIGMNRYYLPALSLLWILALAIAPGFDAKRGPLLLALVLAWSSVSYFTRVRYSSLEDGFVGVRAALAHRRIDRQLETLHDGRPVLTSYPTTLELASPSFGYVTRAIPSRDVGRIGLEESRAGWIVASNVQMNYTDLRDVIEKWRPHRVFSVRYASGAAELFRFE